MRYGIFALILVLTACDPINKILTRGDTPEKTPPAAVGSTKTKKEKTYTGRFKNTYLNIATTDNDFVCVEIKKPGTDKWNSIPIEETYNEKITEPYFIVLSQQSLILFFNVRPSDEYQVTIIKWE